MAPTRPFSGLPCATAHEPRICVYQLPPPAIRYLTALIEASDGIGLVRTLDENRGIIECWMMAEFCADFEQVLEEVGREWPIQRLDAEFE